VARLFGQQGYREVYGKVSHVVLWQDCLVNKVIERYMGRYHCSVVAGLFGQQGYREVYGKVSHVVLWQDCLVNKVIERYMGRYHMKC